MGHLIVIVAPSGTGKSTIINKIREDFPNLIESISTTTRPIRTGEKDGKNYFFVDEPTFIQERDKGEFLEWAKVHSNYYGTSKTFVNKALKNGKNILFDLDVQGCDGLIKVFPKSKVIFIEPPSFEELERRLRGRATDNPEVIEKRLSNAKNELLRKNDYDYLVMNDDFNASYIKIKNLIKKILEE